MKRQGDDCQRVARLADLLAQEFPIQFFLLISDRDVDSLNPRYFSYFGGRICATNVLRAEQATISHHAVDVGHASTLKQPNSPREQSVGRDESQRDHAPNCRLMIAVLS